MPNLTLHRETVRSLAPGAEGDTNDCPRSNDCPRESNACPRTQEAC